MKTIKLTESQLKQIVLFEAYQQKSTEQMLSDLFKYLSQSPSVDIRDNKGMLKTHYAAYNYFEPIGIVHNIWAIHYTNLESFENILQDGFTHGCADLDKLAYSDGKADTSVKNYGWNFALPVDGKYLGEDLGYGDCGFLIRTDGVRAFHKGDGDDEIIFKDCHVKEKIPFVYDEDFKCWLCFDGNQCDVPSAEFKDIESLIQFATHKV